MAAAANDTSYPPVMAEKFERALNENAVRYRTEIYAAPHGWMVPDFPVFDQAEAERGWRRLVEFFAPSAG